MKNEIIDMDEEVGNISRLISFKTIAQYKRFIITAVETLYNYNYCIFQTMINTVGV